MSLEPVKIGSLTCIPLHSDFGAEIQGVDFTVKPLPDYVIQDIITAQDRFGVTVYRNTGLDDQSHVAFSYQLGKLEMCPKLSGPNVPPRFSEPELFDAGNIDREGNLILKGSRRWWYNKGNALWHTDSSFNQLRSKYSLLLAHQIPKEGGDTMYADVRSAYRDLPQAKKNELKDLVVCHNLWHSRKLAAPDEFKSATEYEMSQKPPAYHKLVQTTADGRETLFIAAHSEYIVGRPKDEGLKLIHELLDHCTQPQYVLAVKWKAPGDLVFWDNRCTMHRATPFSDQMEKRDMRRTTV
ncbi:alpha-ketoglutarate-dependent 2,4-dichlorophenoxyacetate dioxygenase [Ramaria rubella]|nr:alpha-ketoglutarate-dependent 2,4-dichlorophenoxyacetate dioxygenase [Ramaria rubella]